MWGATYLTGCCCRSSWCGRCRRCYWYGMGLFQPYFLLNWPLPPLEFYGKLVLVFFSCQFVILRFFLFSLSLKLLTLVWYVLRSYFDFRWSWWFCAYIYWSPWYAFDLAFVFFFLTVYARCFLSFIVKSCTFSSFYCEHLWITITIHIAIWIGY